MKAGALVALALVALGCTNDAPKPTPDPPPTSAAAAPAKHVELVHAPAGDVAELVRTERAKALQEKRDLLVYVGAPWCEPCTRFHKAAAAGELDAVFPTLRLLEFNLDEDRDRLEAAGYTSKMIPLFTVPGADGRATDLHIEGSIKGDGAVAQIAPRLQGLLKSAPR